MKKNNTLLNSSHNFEMRNVTHSIKYDVNSLYGIEDLPLSNFDKIPHILNECLTFSYLIGNGAFGMVFKGTMKIESDDKKTIEQPVALKVIKYFIEYAITLILRFVMENQ